MNKFKLGISAAALFLGVLTANAQTTEEEHSNPNVRAGQQALLEGNFKSAITHLKKALPQESEDADVQYLLGYAQFQEGKFKESDKTFDKVIALNPNNASAYYYKGKANNNIANDKQIESAEETRVDLLQTAIADYSKAISLASDDPKFYQNRATAYRDLGILTGTKGGNVYNKDVAKDAYNKAVIDLEKVLSFDASRKDIQTEVKKAKVYRDNLK